MTDKELKKLKRAELLEILLQQREEIDRLTAELKEKNKLLEDRTIRVQESGTLAEASLRLNKVFEAAQAAADQYLENMRIRAEEGAGNK